MMKYPAHAFLRALTVVLPVVLGPSFLQARIGESREAIERRLSSSGGIVYRDDAVEAERSKDMPYLEVLDYMPDSTEVRIYFKTADGRRPSQSELEGRRMSPGWDLHVVYVRGQSKLEVYKRSRPMTEYEKNELLSRLAEGSFWKRVEKKGNQEEEVPSVFGFDMVRDDGKVRAKEVGRFGDTLMVFDADMDARLAEIRDAARLKNAPTSVEGF